MLHKRKPHLATEKKIVFYHSLKINKREGPNKILTKILNSILNSDLSSSSNSNSVSNQVSIQV